MIFQALPMPPVAIKFEIARQYFAFRAQTVHSHFIENIHRGAQCSHRQD